ncbi:LysM peptidoglycan-binding domain-containing protein [Georgenia halophila]
MSALTAHPAVVPGPSRARARRHLELVRPGFVGQPAAPARMAQAPASAAPAAAPGAAAPPMRLTVRGRRVLATLGLVAATAMSVAVGGWAGSAVAEPAPAAAETVTVAPGQTLWAVADANAGPGTDVRELVEQIVAINGLESTELHVGQQLQVPRG